MRNSKLFKVILLSFLIAFLFSGSALAQTANQIMANLAQFRVFFNSRELPISAPIVTIDGKTYVPLREFAENTGMSIEWDGAEKRIDLGWRGSGIDCPDQEKTEGDEKMKVSENMISLFVYASSGLALAFRIDLSCDGSLAATVGKTTSFEFADDGSFFTPRVTRYKTLDDSEFKELADLISKITIDEEGDGTGMDDGWYFTTIHNDSVRRYCEFGNRSYWLGSEHMYDIIERLIEYSPIEITTYAYDDPYKSDYYESLEW